MMNFQIRSSDAKYLKEETISTFSGGVIYWKNKIKVIYLKNIRCPKTSSPDGFPFSLPFVQSIEDIKISENVLFFVGENGSGKSTLLESLGIATKRINIGGSDLERDQSLDAIKPLAKNLRLSWNRRTGTGFFLRAEDFFGFLHRNKRLE